MQTKNSNNLEWFMNVSHRETITDILDIVASEIAFLHLKKCTTLSFICIYKILLNASCLNKQLTNRSYGSVF